MALNTDDTLFNGHYRIIRQLGRGGFGFVYHAQDTLLGENVAIKELIPALVGDETMLKRFLTEAKATMRLTHKQIVRTHNIFSEHGNYYIVMEYMVGGSLEARLQTSGMLSVEEAVRVATEVCDGLHCAHEQGVIHCDMKPANILFDAKDSAKVSDFGIAHISDETLSRSWATPSGFIAGTVPYMSPEQADGVRDDPRLDVYALGAVLYRMLTGRTYLDFDPRETPRSQSENIQRIYQQLPVPPSNHNSCVPPWLDQVVLTALSKRAAERYRTVMDMRTALLSRRSPAPFVPRMTSSAPVRTMTVPARSRPVARSSSWWKDNRVRTLTGGAFALVAVIAFAAIALLGDREPSDTPTATPTSVLTATPTVAGETTPTFTSPTVPSPTVISSPTVAPTATGPVPTVIPTASSTPTGTATITPASTATFTAIPGPSNTAVPAAGRIAFASDRGGNVDIWLMNANGSGLTQLTHSPADDRWPTWSPNGQRIAFMSNRDGHWEIYAINVDGTGLANLSNNPANDYSPCWSPDGRRIAFYSDRAGNDDIWVLNADGSGQQALTSQPGDERDPTWAPDNKHLAFRAEPGGNVDIYAINSNGSGLTRLTDNPGDDWYPSWSPDGKLIAFTSKRDGQKEIYLMNTDGSEQRNLTNHPSEDWMSSWSPNSQRLVFTSDRDGAAELYVINVDGSGQKNLTNSPGKDHDSAWSRQ